MAIAFAGAGLVFLLTGNSTAWVFLPLGVVFIALAINDKTGTDDSSNKTDE